jgi:hypothetical protein
MRPVGYKALRRSSLHWSPRRLPFGLVSQSGNNAPASSFPSSSSRADPEVFISSVTNVYKENKTATSGEHLSQIERSPIAVSVTGVSRYVPPLPPKPKRKQAAVIVATAQLKDNPRGLWLVSEPARVKATGEWAATVRLRSKQLRSATLTIVALVVPYGTLESYVVEGSPSCARSPCEEPTPTSFPSEVEKHGPKLKNTIARSAERTTSFNSG